MKGAQGVQCHTNFDPFIQFRVFKLNVDGRSGGELHNITSIELNEATFNVYLQDTLYTLQVQIRLATKHET